MKIYISHPSHKDNPFTFLTADSAASASSLSVGNTSGFSTNKFLVLGKIGQDQTEIIRAGVITAPSTFGTFDSAPKFPHNADDIVTLFDWNKIRVYRSTTGSTGSYSLVSTLDIDIDSDVTVYEDADALTNYYYKFAPYNSVTEVEGDLSDAIASTGFVFYSLKTMTDRVLSLFGDAKAEFVTRDEVKDWLTEIYEFSQQQVAISTDRFNISTQVITLQADVTEYDLEADFLVEKAVRVSEDGGTTYKKFASNKQLDSMGKVIQSNIKYGYTIKGSKIVIDDPIPSNGSDKIKVYYIPSPFVLSDQTDTLQAPFVNSSGMFVKYALAHCFLKDKKNEDYKLLKDEAENKVAVFVSYIKKLTNRHPQFSELMNAEGI